MEAAALARRRRFRRTSFRARSAGRGALLQAVRDSLNAAASTSRHHLDAEESCLGSKVIATIPARSCRHHDSYFLDNVTGGIAHELDSRQGDSLRGCKLPACAGEKQKTKKKRWSREGARTAAIRKTMVSRQEWIASSPKARQAKSKESYQRYEAG